jgi:NADH-quinone oxidoreductase subunit E
MQLSSETLEKIDVLIPRYPVKRSAVLPLLHLVQAEAGYISDEGIEWIAEKLGLQPINVYELVTFYPFFRQQPIGRRHIRVCRTLPCALVGAYETCRVLSETLDCPEGSTSEDGEVTLEFAECLAGCGMGPVVMVDEEFHENVDERRAKEIAREVRGEREGE